MTKPTLTTTTTTETTEAEIARWEAAAAKIDAVKATALTPRAAVRPWWKIWNTYLAILLGLFVAADFATGHLVAGAITAFGAAFQVLMVWSRTRPPTVPAPNTLESLEAADAAADKILEAAEAGCAPAALPGTGDAATDGWQWQTPPKKWQFSDPADAGDKSELEDEFERLTAAAREETDENQRRAERNARQPDADKLEPYENQAFLAMNARMRQHLGVEMVPHMDPSRPGWGEYRRAVAEAQSNAAKVQQEIAGELHEIRRDTERLRQAMEQRLPRGQSDAAFWAFVNHRIT